MEKLRNAYDREINMQVRSLSPPVQERNSRRLNRTNSLDELRLHASTPETGIINSSGNRTNLGINESNIGSNAFSISAAESVNQMLAEQEDQEVMINNQQNNRRNSFGIGSD